MASNDIAIDAVLAGHGIASSENVAGARAAMERAGLTNARKSRIAINKIERVNEFLSGTFTLRCHECSKEAATATRVILVVEASHCEECGGSAARRLALKLGGYRRGLRILVVGGSRGTRAELGSAVADIAEVRFVDGLARHTQVRALAGYRWADVVVIWASTELKHRVSTLYTEMPDEDGKMLIVARRSVVALLEAVVVRLTRGT